jgi:hypothetical protein
MSKRATTLLCRLAITAATAVMSCPTPASAQETRAEEIAAKQEEKARRISTYQPRRFERILIRLEENLVSPPTGFFPAFGSIYSGGGFTAGVGYRHFYARRAVWDVRGLYSIKNYKQIEIGTRTPWHGTGRWMLGGRAGWLDAPQIGYYGLGMQDTARRANFRLTQGYAAANAALRPTSWTRLHGEIAYEDYRTARGAGRHPSIEQLHTAASAPALFANPAFIRTQALAAIDWRTSPGYSRSGGFYGLTLTNYADRADTHSFRRLDGEIVQHIPLLRENWVLSFRARAESTLDAADNVPYFLLPQLGSGSTLRGYGTGRFRDRHSLLTSAEFRWIPSRAGLDMAIFYDAGKVARRRTDLDFRDLATDWGIGARFHGPTATVLRIEAARGSDGWRLVVATSPAF